MNLLLNGKFKSTWNLFVIDFCCAITAATIYLFLFEFMIETIGLPIWMAKTQLIANFSYGFYGIILFFSRAKHLVFFRFLVTMNFIYAFFCLAIAIMITLDGNYIGAALLFFEGVFIALLAKLELKYLAE